MTESQTIPRQVNRPEDAAASWGGRTACSDGSERCPTRRLQPVRSAPRRMESPGDLAFAGAAGALVAKPAERQRARACAYRDPRSSSPVVVEPTEPTAAMSEPVPLVPLVPLMPLVPLVPLRRIPPGAAMPLARRVTRTASRRRILHCPAPLHPLVDEELSSVVLRASRSPAELPSPAPCPPSASPTRLRPLRERAWPGRLRQNQTPHQIRRRS